MSFKKYRDIILGVGMLLFSMFYLSIAQNIKTRPKLTPSYGSAKIVPILLGCLLAILSVICIIEGIYKMKKYGTTMTNAKAGANTVKADMMTVLLTFAIMIIYVLMLPVAGFCLSTVIYLFCQITILSPAAKRNYVLFAIVALAFTVFVFVAFRIGLTMMLPRGPIEALLGF